MTQSVKLLTLNCWGVFTPLACQFKQERITAIANELSKGEYDIVLLQEVWTQADYKLLCDKILPAMQHTHYFHSGLFGSGLCIFSKHRILETMQHRYMPNGYAHKVYHGDWFGGKSVGLAKMLVNSVRVNVYVSHLHAEYHRDNDEYAAHRAAQAYQLSQFIRNTSEVCDVVIAGGDFNLQPTDLGFSVVCSNAALQDAWTTQKNKENLTKNGNTCERPDNTFSSASSLAIDPLGIRLDYLLYRSNAGYSMECEQCYLTMQQIPGEKYHYSDHEGVTATFTIRKNTTGPQCPTREPAVVTRHLSAVLPILERGSQRGGSDRLFYAFATLLCVIFLIYTHSLQLPVLLSAGLVLMRAVAVIVGFGSLWMCIVMVNREMNELLDASKDVSNMLRSLQLEN